MFKIRKNTMSFEEQSEINRIKATNEVLEEALLEMAQNYADLEDAVCELAELITEVN